MTLSKSKTSSLAASLSTSSANSASSSHNGAASTLSTHNGQKSASNYQECADCSSPSAFWASLNHGVVVCDQCCLAHRSLGRAISIIKSLKKSYWPQSQIDTLYELVRNNSNSIWEANLNNSAELMKHSLLKNLKKPTPKDSYTNKANYVKIKYENLALISRGKYTSIDELNQQLLASVRTSDLKSTLRILSQGADANYRNPEDGNQCVHAAVVAGELGQIELLCLYGADVAALDRNGLTPSEIARMHHPTQPHIADRLVELQFELTDELSYFLASKRPDHRNARHFLIPDIENFSNMKDAMSRLKLDELPDHLFEELAKDIYDEMDRRQIESIWKCTVSQNLVNEPIPFLVIKSCFTQMRNQLRQKLARFNSHEFSCLLLEILNESQRRYNQIENPISPKGGLSLDDDEEEEDPLYDKVPSDEDYASVASESSSTIQVPVSSSSNTPSKTLKSTTTTLTTPKKSLYQTLSPLNILTSASAAAGKLTGSASPTKTLKAAGSPSAATTTSSSSKSSSNKNTPSPKSSSLFPTSGVSSSHKILNTKFEKVPTASTAALAAATSALSTSGLPSGVLQLNSGPANSSALVANAESCLNSIINSLNQIDYSHLAATHAAAAAAVSHGSNHRNYCGGLTNNESPSSATDFVVQPASIGEIRPNLYNELKSENELMQAMIERLMDENAQLRAEKMLLTANSNTTSSTASTINSDTNITHYAMYVENRPSSRSVTEELSLYSTVKNPTKKSSKSDFNQQQHANIFDEHSNYKKFYDDSNNLEIIEEGLYQYDESTNQEQESEKLKSNAVSSKEKLFPTSKSGQYYNSGSNNGAESMSQLPSKDSVIRAMKKITKTVQDLFKATKLSEFSNLKASCDKVNNSVHEMISLFPLNLNSAEIEENLITLEETCKNLTDLMGEYSVKIDLFVSNGGRENDGENTIDSSSSSSKQQQISTSSSSSSAISSSNSDQFKHQQQQQQQLSADDIAIKNMIITNLVSYSYEIAHTVKRIVCAMGAD